jgi:HEPN domain-containing protein
MKPNPVLQKVVEVILNTVPTVKIVLLAYVNKRNEAFSIFEKTLTEVKDPVELNIFVIAKISDEDRHAAMDTIEQRCRNIISITILTMTIEQFSSLENRRSFFAHTILQSKQILYKERVKFPRTGRVGNEVVETTNADADLTSWYKRAVTFWDIAGTQFRFGEYGMAAFCIHQAAEQFLNMLLQATIGYRMGTHNLDKLLRLLRFYIPDVADVFKKETPLEKEKFLLLKNTYIHFRYRSDFNITENDVHYFMEEVAKIQWIAEKGFQRKNFLLQGSI